jgi:hypothetical protein
MHISWCAENGVKKICVENGPYLSVLQYEVMTCSALSSMLVKSVPPSASNCKAAASSSSESGEPVKSFSMDVDGLWLKKIRLYASLLPPPTGELQSIAAWCTMARCRSCREPKKRNQVDHLPWARCALYLPSWGVAVGLAGTWIRI